MEIRKSRENVTIAKIQAKLDLVKETLKTLKLKSCKQTENKERRSGVSL